MDFGKKYGKIVIFINHTQLIFYGTNIKNLIALPLKPDTIRDLEIVNKDQLEKELSTFIQTNKLLPAAVTIILSNTLVFSKNFPAIGAQYKEEQLKADIETFLNYVPFQNPLHKIITTAKGTSVVVANGDLYTGLKQIFEQLKFMVESMIPLVLLDPQIGDNFSAKVGQTVENKWDWIKQNGFVIIDPVKIEGEPVEQAEEDGIEAQPKKSNKSFLLFGVFFILIGVLVVMLILQQNSKPKTTQTLATVPTGLPTDSPSQTISVLPTQPEASQSSNIKDSDTTVQILNGSGIPGEADTLRRQLLDAGFSNIQTGNSSVTLAKTLIVFSTRISTETKNRIIDIVKASYPDLSTQDSSTVESDVIITTSRPVSPTPTP